MNRTVCKQIKIAAEGSIEQMRKARAAANDFRNALAPGAPGVVNLQGIINTLRTAHQNATSTARELVNAVVTGGVTSLTQLAQNTLSGIEDAGRNANSLSTTSTDPQVLAVVSVDDAALAQLASFQEAFRNTAEFDALQPFEFGDLLRGFARITPTQAFGLATGVGLFVLATIGLYVLGSGILRTKDIVNQLANIDQARGLITYILAVGTIAVALLLVVAALLGTEQNKENFSRGKEVLAVLIGIFGTILGFYYGQSTAPGQKGKETGGTTTASATPSPNPSPTATASVMPSAKETPTPSATLAPSATPSATPTPSGSATT